MDLLGINFEKMQKSFAPVEDSLTRRPPLKPEILNDSLAMEPLHETYANLLRQDRCSFPISSMLVGCLEKLQIARAVISLGLN